VFVVGYLGDWRRAAAVLFERASLRGDTPPRREAGQGVTGPIAGCSNGGGANGPGRSADDADSLIPLAKSLLAKGNSSHREDSDTYIPVISPALKSRDYKGPSSDGDGDGAPLIAFNLTPSNSNKDFNAWEASYAQAITGNGNRVSARGGDQIAHSLRAEGFDASEDGTGRGTPIVPVALQSKASATNSMNLSDVAPTLDIAKAGGTAICFSSKDHGADAGDIAPTLRSGGHDKSHANGGVMPAVAFALRGREGGAMPEVHDHVSALRSASGGATRDFVAFAQNQRDEVREMNLCGSLAAQPGAKQQTYVRTSAVRRLTPRECERLQGFPDDHTLITMRGKPAADGPRYKALGNSMAVPVMNWIGRRIAMVDAAGLVRMMEAQHPSPSGE